MHYVLNWVTMVSIGWGEKNGGSGEEMEVLCGQSGLKCEGTTQNENRLEQRRRESCSTSMVGRTSLAV